MKPSHTVDLEIKAAVITVSTTRTPETDVSGTLLRDHLIQAGIQVSHYSIVPDRIPDLHDALREALQKANCVIFCGGTGLTQDDCTIEAICPQLEKRIDGFGELFRWMSYEEIGTSAILSRAIGGIIDSRAVFCIPGSPSAARLAISSLIIPEISHILSHAQKR